MATNLHHWDDPDEYHFDLPDSYKCQAAEERPGGAEPPKPLVCPWAHLILRTETPEVAFNPTVTTFENQKDGTFTTSNTEYSSSNGNVYKPNSGTVKTHTTELSTSETSPPPATHPEAQGSDTAEAKSGSDLSDAIQKEPRVMKTAKMLFLETYRHPARLTLKAEKAALLEAKLVRRWENMDHEQRAYWKRKAAEYNQHAGVNDTNMQVSGMGVVQK